MELDLYLREGEFVKHLKVPQFVVKDLLRDRLSSSELDRINRFAEKISIPSIFKPGSVVVDFSSRTAQCFAAGLNLEHLEPTWKVKVPPVTLVNY